MLGHNCSKVTVWRLSATYSWSNALQKYDFPCVCTFKTPSEIDKHKEVTEMQCMLLKLHLVFLMIGQAATLLSILDSQVVSLPLQSVGNSHADVRRFKYHQS